LDFFNKVLNFGENQKSMLYISQKIAEKAHEHLNHKSTTEKTRQTLLDKTCTDIYNQYKLETGLEIPNEHLAQIIQYWFECLNMTFETGSNLHIAGLGKFGIKNKRVNSELTKTELSTLSLEEQVDYWKEHGLNKKVDNFNEFVHTEELNNLLMNIV